MFIPNFTLALFLAAMTWVAINRSLPPAPVGGPVYYAAAPVAWPLQPKYRLNAYQALRSKRVILADFDDRCLPVLARHMVGGKEQWRMVWLWDHRGRLRWRLWEDPYGRVTRRQELF